LRTLSWVDHLSVISFGNKRLSLFIPVKSFVKHVRLSGTTSVSQRLICFVEAATITLQANEMVITHASLFSPSTTLQCPECKYTVTRRDESDLSVRCQVCTVRNGEPYEFCWQCLRQWKGPHSRTDRCENDGCYNEALKTLTTCENITFQSIKEITGCPSIRACPTCGFMLEHSSKACKNIKCPQCKVEFCFVCLKITTDCLKTSSHYIPCSSGVAPRQTSIPVWQRKWCHTGDKHQAVGFSRFGVFSWAQIVSLTVFVFSWFSICQIELFLWESGFQINLWSEIVSLTICH